MDRRTQAKHFATWRGLRTSARLLRSHGQCSDLLYAFARRSDRHVCLKCERVRAARYGVRCGVKRGRSAGASTRSAASQQERAAAGGEMRVTSVNSVGAHPPNRGPARPGGAAVGGAPRSSVWARLVSTAPLRVGGPGASRVRASWRPGPRGDPRTRWATLDVPRSRGHLVLTPLRCRIGPHLSSGRLSQISKRPRRCERLAFA